jgi:hypothetical protein
MTEQGNDLSEEEREAGYVYFCGVFYSQVAGDKDWRAD